jgi:hypothetical protein
MCDVGGALVRWCVRALVGRRTWDVGRGMWNVGGVFVRWCVRSLVDGRFIGERVGR